MVTFIFWLGVVYVFIFLMGFYLPGRISQFWQDNQTATVVLFYEKQSSCNNDCLVFSLSGHGTQMLILEKGKGLSSCHYILPQWSTSLHFTWYWALKDVLLKTRTMHGASHSQRLCPTAELTSSGCPSGTCTSKGWFFLQKSWASKRKEHQFMEKDPSIAV